jgi:hypothetical protein
MRRRRRFIPGYDSGMDNYAGDEPKQRAEDNRIVIEVVQERHLRSLAGTLRDKVGRVPDDESWDALRDAAWRAPDPDHVP